MNWPEALKEISPLYGWLNRCLFAGKAGQIVQSPDVVPRRTVNGTQLQVNFPPPPRPVPFHPFKIQKVGDFQYCVRGGYVGVRPRNGAGDPYNMNFNRNISEYRLLIQKGSDQVGTAYKGIPGYRASDFYKNAPVPKEGGTGVQVVTVGNSGDFGASNDTNAVIFKLNQQQDSSISDPAAAFFIDLTDDDENGARGEIKCRMVTTTGTSSLGRTNTMFPDDCVPIGLVIPSGGNWGSAIAATPAPLEIEQLLYDHYLYRVPHFNCGNPFHFWNAQMPLQFLGVWNDTSDSYFADKVYYPGDVVLIDDTYTTLTSEAGGSETVSIEYRNAYVKVPPAEAIGSRPMASGAPAWELLAGLRT